MGPFVASDTGTAFGSIAQSQSNQPFGVVGGGNLPALGSTKYRALAVVVTPGGTATSVTFTSLQSGTALSAAFAIAANKDWVLPYNPYGWFDTLNGESFGITTGAGSTVAVHIVYGKIGTGT